MDSVFLYSSWFDKNGMNRGNTELCRESVREEGTEGVSMAEKAVLLILCPVQITDKAVS